MAAAQIDAPTTVAGENGLQGNAGLSKPQEVKLTSNHLYLAQFRRQIYRGSALELSGIF